MRPTADVAEPFAILASLDAGWPKSNPKQRSEEYSWKGYRLDENRRPTFAYTWNNVKITDRFDPESDATEGGKLVRTLKLTGSIPANTYLRIASGTFQPVGSGFTVAGGALNVAATGAKVAGADLVNGLLHIDLKREIPDQAKPRRIDIVAGTPQPKVIDQAA